MKKTKKENIGLYEAYYNCYQNILAENGIKLTRQNICNGVKETTFNKGVVEFFERFQSYKTGIKHYIVTSGIQDYVEETEISKYVNGIYGVTFKSNDGVYDGVDRLLTDEKKVEIIKNIQRANNGTNNVIYFGDGLTDKFAFEYVHKIGGKSVFITTNPKSQEVYKNLNANGIIDEIFQADYSTSSDISRFIQREIELEKNQER